MQGIGGNNTKGTAGTPAGAAEHQRMQPLPAEELCHLPPATHPGQESQLSGWSLCCSSTDRA